MGHYVSHAGRLNPVVDFFPGLVPRLERAGDLVEADAACYTGDAQLADWPATLEAIRAFDLDAIAPGRGDAVLGRAAVNAALDRTKDFVLSTYAPAARVAARGGSLKEAWDAVRAELRFG